MSNVLRIAAAALILGTACAQQSRVLSIHLADYAASPPADRFRIEMTNGEAPLYAESAPVLDDRDFSSAQPSADNAGRPQLQLCFSREGRERFKRVAQANVGRRLVFLIRGRVLFAPVIESADVSECVTITGDVSAEDADALQRAIRTAG